MVTARTNPLLLERSSNKIFKKRVFNSNEQKESKSNRHYIRGNYE